MPTLPKDKGSTWCGPYLEAEPFPIRYPLTAIPFIVAWLGWHAVPTLPQYTPTQCQPYPIPGTVRTGFSLLSVIPIVCIINIDARRGGNSVTLHPHEIVPRPHYRQAQGNYTTAQKSAQKGDILASYSSPPPPFSLGPASETPG